MRAWLMAEIQEGPGWADWCALAEAAERLGFDGLFTSDHYGPTIVDEERGGFDAWGLLCGLACRTDRLRLGTLVSPATFRSLGALAKLATTADHISGGRIEVGLGAGWNEREHQEWGFAFGTLDERLTRMEEQGLALRSLLDGGEVTVAGAHVALDRARLLPRPPQSRVPIVIGGLAKPRTARLAAAIADDYNLVFVTPDEARAARSRLDAACEAVGRDPGSLQMSLMCMCIVGRDEREFAARLERYAGRLLLDVDAAREAWGHIWLAGTVEQLVARLVEYADAGIERVVLQHLVHDDLEMVELLGSEVLPAIAQA